MHNLYSDLAEVYEAMYQTFIDYEEEYQYYAALLGEGNGRTLLEIGCGSGHLAGRFGQSGFRYTGLDLSADMLTIAREKYPASRFIQADMRRIELTEPVDAAIMTGRTISYLLHNRDVADCFASVLRNLKKGGLFCFDFIDANRFIPHIRENERVVHRAAYQGRRFFRDSFWKVNPDYSWAFDWQSVYYEETDQGPVRIGADHSTIRAFTKNEIELFLELAGFEKTEFADRASYAFETFVARSSRIDRE